MPLLSGLLGFHSTISSHRVSNAPTGCPKHVDLVPLELEGAVATAGGNPRVSPRRHYRLNGIDAPEKGQAFGERAKQFTAGLAFGQVVQVVVRDHDRYGRTVADVVLADGRSLSHEVVRGGYAWWFRRYSRDPRLAALEAEAQAARAGLWADRLPVPPWEWRRMMKARRVALERRRDARSERRLSSTGRLGTSRRFLAGLPSPP